MSKTKRRRQPHRTTAERKGQVLAFIIRHVDEWRFPPTMREIASGVELSLGRVQQVYEELVAEGVIERAVGRARAYVVDRDAAALYLRSEEVRDA